MEIKRELAGVAAEGRALFQECRDVFIAESMSMAGLGGNA